MSCKRKTASACLKRARSTCYKGIPSRGIKVKVLEPKAKTQIVAARGEKNITKYLLPIGPTKYVTKGDKHRELITIQGKIGDKALKQEFGAGEGLVVKRGYRRSRSKA